MYDNVFNSDVCDSDEKCDKRSVALPSDNVTCKNNRDRVTVVTRVFYNSKCQKENVKALFSRGNKKRLLTQGRQVKTHVPHSHRTSGVPNISDRAHGVTVSTQPPQVSDVNDTSQKLVHQVMSSKPTGEGADPQVFPLISHVELNSKSGDHLPEGHVKKVTPAIGSCDVDSVHEPSVSNSSVIGGDTITHENQEYEDTPGGGDGQNFAPLFDINECLEGDKYLNTIVNKKLNKALNDNKHMACDIFRLWRAQSEFDFGFIPLSDFILPSDESISEYVSCPIECHRKVKASGNMNFLKCRIPVQSQLNIVEWETQLQGYWDVQLIQLLKFGFPLDFNRSSVLRHDNKNHTSALDFPAHVDAYLTEELRYGAILGPYVQNPIPDCHFSPFMTREKSNSTNRRVIIDLSWPKDYSVNAGVDKNSYLGTDFVLSFPTIDDITEGSQESW